MNINVLSKRDELTVCSSWPAFSEHFPQSWKEKRKRNTVRCQHPNTTLYQHEQFWRNNDHTNAIRLSLTACTQQFLPQLTSVQWNTVEKNTNIRDRCVVSKQWNNESTTLRIYVTKKQKIGLLSQIVNATISPNSWSNSMDLCCLSTLDWLGMCICLGLSSRTNETLICLWTLKLFILNHWLAKVQFW